MNSYSLETNHAILTNCSHVLPMVTHRRLTLCVGFIIVSTILHVVQGNSVRDVAVIMTVAVLKIKKVKLFINAEILSGGLCDKRNDYNNTYLMINLFI